MRKVILLAAATLPILASALQAAAPQVVYNATGVFAVPVNGQDPLRLAGQAFNFNVTVSESAKPTKENANSAKYDNLPLTGTVYSGLLPGEAIPLTGGILGNLSLEVGAPSQHDVMTFRVPLTVTGTPYTFSVKFVLPAGTLTSKAIRPFSAPVTLMVSDGADEYATATGPATILVFGSGTLSTSVQ